MQPCAQHNPAVDPISSTTAGVFFSQWLPDGVSRRHLQFLVTDANTLNECSKGTPNPGLGGSRLTPQASSAPCQSIR